MFSTLYVPLLSALAAPEASATMIGEVMDGNLTAAAQRASRLAERAVDAGEHSTQASASLRLNADMQAVRGATGDAEATYRLAQKKLDAPKPDQRALSCRNAGWQALLRHRVGMALLCFVRVLDEPDIRIDWRLEAQSAIACTLAELGDANEALAAVEDIATLLDSEDIDVRSASAWRDLVATLRFDLAVQNELRSSARLDDHVYWKSATQDEWSAHREDPAARLHTAAQTARTVRTPLLARRVEYLVALREVLNGDREALVDISDHLDWGRQNGLADYVRTTRIEVALALIASGCSDIAERVLEPLQGSHRNGGTSHRELDYAYCAAKTGQARGRNQEALDLYKRHALIATRTLRQNSQAVVSYAGRCARKPAQLDDVGARLPAKYRRAYAYLQANLDRDDLSVHEVAIEIGVTERALQSAFKTFLGLSPTEVIRRERMDRIRTDLLDKDRSILDTANKWGVRSRSALVSGYRKQFNEAPSETLDR
ncbi:MAG: helix-turn-helix transcriptional regulator [Burkholderiaceae bacterium]